MTGFAKRLSGAVAERGRLCVGIDPHASLLADWGLPDSAEGAREFGLRVVAAAAGRVGIVKPQNAFFERHGSAGYAALERVLADARTAGLLVIADVKRGDIGSTVDAYGEAWLAPGSPLEADAMTAVAFQGVGSLAGVLDRAAAHGKGVFVLAATSNPESAATQRASRDDGLTVSAGIVAELRPWVGTVGVVIGATVDLAGTGIPTASLEGIPILAPGFGAQGVRFSQFPARFGPLAGQTIVSVSRELLAAGPHGLPGAISRAQDELAAAA